MSTIAGKIWSCSVGLQKGGSSYQSVSPEKEYKQAPKGIKTLNHKISQPGDLSAESIIYYRCANGGPIVRKPLRSILDTSYNLAYSMKWPSRSLNLARAYGTKNDNNNNNKSKSKSPFIFNKRTKLTGVLKHELKNLVNNKDGNKKIYNFNKVLGDPYF